MNETIFVQIASYRDPQLLPTLKDLFKQAKYPDNIKVCVAWQRNKNDEWDNLDEFKDDTRLDIIDIDYLTAKGACWARNLIQQRYNGETYTLQLDSHHRFSKDWDETCITMLKGLQDRGYKKPLLTSYIPSFDPDNDPNGRVDTPWGMSFDRFTPEGVVFFMPYYMERYKLNPEPARWFSAHFCFTLGQHCIEVQHDPEYYFHGEEITLAVRSFTHGYDLFHPNKVIAFHEYTRKGRTKQWDDDTTWNDKNLFCHKKVRSLLGVDGENEIKEEKYGLGTERTLQEYEIYAGIKFKSRSITKQCKDNFPPPGDKDSLFYQEFKHAIGVNHKNFPKDDYTFCAVIFEDKEGNSLHREDYPGNLFNAKLNSARNGEEFIIWKTYQGPKPDKIILWACNEKGWQEKNVQNL
jgi:hypothetical protein